MSLQSFRLFGFTIHCFAFTGVMPINIYMAPEHWNSSLFASVYFYRYTAKNVNPFVIRWHLFETP
ncbi:hypothetical protein ALT785_700033 [Alteromonas infernus]